MGITTPTPWNDLTHTTLVAWQSVSYPIDTKVLSIENFQLAAHCVNNFNELVEALEDAKRQIEYLHDKFKETGTGNAVLAIIDSALKKATN